MSGKISDICSVVNRVKVRLHLAKFSFTSGRIHAFEWGFVRLAPFALIVALVGVFLTRKKAG